MQKIRKITSINLDIEIIEYANKNGISLTELINSLLQEQFFSISSKIKQISEMNSKIIYLQSEIEDSKKLIKTKWNKMSEIAKKHIEYCVQNKDKYNLYALHKRFILEIGDISFQDFSIMLDLYETNNL